MADGLTITPNVFQRLMLQWERFAPYNAGQFVTLDRDIESTHAARAWRSTVIRLGLQQVGQHPDTPLSETDAPIDPFISAQMNHRFAPADSPFHPFVLRNGNQTHLGITYRHVVADSASIRFVMRTWFEQLFAGSTDVPFQPVTPMREPLFAMLRDQRWNLVREVMAEISRLSRMKRVRRLSLNDPTQPIAWKQVVLAEGLIDRLLMHARSTGVKVNDLFVAAAADACDRHLPHEHADARRDLAIGTIVDVRPPGDRVQDRFGLSLGFLQTLWRWQQLQQWESILSTAAAQSKWARTRRLAHASQLRLRAAVWHGDRKSESQLSTFYRKRCPLAAGISNVNLNVEWPASHHPTPLARYTRVSPAGPMLPIVFTPTTLGRTLTLGYSYRERVVPADVAERILHTFIRTLESLGTE